MRTMVKTTVDHAKHCSRKIDFQFSYRNTRLWKWFLKLTKVFAYNPLMCFLKRILHLIYHQAESHFLTLTDRCQDALLICMHSYTQMQVASPLCWETFWKHFMFPSSFSFHSFSCTSDGNYIVKVFALKKKRKLHLFRYLSAVTLGNALNFVPLTNKLMNKTRFLKSWIHRRIFHYFHSY